MLGSVTSTREWLRARVLSSELSRRIAHGAFWSVAGSLISQSMTLLSFILVAKILGTASFGEIGILQSTLAMMVVIGGFRMGAAATKFIASHFRSDRERTGRIMGLVVSFAFLASGVTSVALLLSARVLAERTLAAPHLTSSLRVLSLLLFASTWCEVFIGMLTGFEAFKKIARVNLITGLATFPLLMTGAYFGAVFGIACALTTLRLLQAILAGLEVRRTASAAGIRGTFAGCFGESQALLHYCLPAVCMGLLLAPVTWISQALLVNQPDGYHNMGLFNAANQWNVALQFLPSMIIGSTLPIFAERLASNHTREARRLFWTLLKMDALIMVPIAGLALFTPWIMGLYGSGFVVGWPTLTISLVTSGVMLVDKTAQYVVFGSGRMWLDLLFHLCWGAVFLGTALYLIPIGYGSFGLATARLLAYLLQAILGFALAIRLLK